MVVSGHPRLFLLEKDIPDLRRKTEDREPNPMGVTPKDIWEDIRRYANSLLRQKTFTVYKGYHARPEGYTISLIAPEQPPRHDNGWHYWTHICWDLATRMEALALSYLITDKSSYLKRCKAMMLSISDWKNWSDPDYPSAEKPLPCCLDTWSLLSSMAVAYDFLHNYLNPDERTKITEAMVEKGISPVYEHSLMEGTFAHNPKRWPNGYAMVHAALGLGSLALLGEHPEAEKWLDHEKERTKLFLDQEIGMDGGLVEGLDYGNVALTPLVRFMAALKRVTGEDMFKHPSLCQVVYFPLYTLAPGGKTAVNFCDAGGPEGCKPTFGVVMSCLAAEYKNGYAQWYLKETEMYKQSWGRDDLLRLLWFNPTMEIRSPEDLPSGRHFRSIGWVAMRSGWNPKDTLVAFKSGPHRSHSNADKNSFIINHAGEWVANDPGYQRYDRPYPSDPPGTDAENIRLWHLFSHGTLGHNAILVDGEGQEPRDGRIQSFSLSDFGAQVIGDATEAYPTLKKAIRQMSFLKPRYIIVLDQLESDEPKLYDFLLHTHKRGRITAKGKTVTVRVRKAGLKATVLQPTNPKITVKTYPKAEKYGPYAEIQYPEKVKAAEFLIILQPYEQSRTSKVP